MNQNDKNIAKAVKAAVREFDAAAEVVLFGSRARRDARADSDYDFLVLFSHPIDAVFKTNVLNRIYEIELNSDIAISPFIQNKQDWIKMTAFPIFQEISDHGISV